MTHDPTDQCAASAVAEPDVTVPEFLAWHESATVDGSDLSRRFPPLEEFERRSRAISRLGRAMVMGFFFPTLGGASWIAFPQFDLVGLGGSVAVMALLPLVVGIATIVAACFDGMVRGAVTLAGGLSLFVAALGFDGMGTILHGSWRVGPSPVQASMTLLLVAMFGLFVASRVRWYRPLQRGSYYLSCLAAACYGGFLLYPVGGFLPIAEPVKAFERSLLLGSSLAAHMGLMILASLVAVANRLSTPPHNATRRAGLTFSLLVFSALAPLGILGVALVGELGRASDVGALLLQLGSATVKALLTMGAMLLLIPVGTADLWIGRSDAADQ